MRRHAFFGPPGTGKTRATQRLTAQLDMDIYEVDRSQAVDQYMGKSEKRLVMADVNVPPVVEIHASVRFRKMGMLHTHIGLRSSDGTVQTAAVSVIFVP